MDAKTFFKKFAPYLAGVGHSLVNFDSNDMGGDDIAGNWLLYGADVIRAVSDNTDLPPLPAQVRGVKLNGIAAGALTTVSAVLGVAEFQLTGKFAAALRYINQGISALIAGRPLPPVPANVQA